MRTAILRFWGRRSTIAKIAGPVFAAYSIVVSPVLDDWTMNLVVVLGIGAVIVVGVLVMDVSRRHRVTRGELLPAGAGTRRFLQEELDRAATGGYHPWWEEQRSEARWFEDFFAFWYKTRPVSAGHVEIALDQPPLRADLFVDMPAEAVRPAVPHRKKAALAGMSQFLSDTDWRLHCATVDWELTQWVERNYETFARANPGVSAFGIQGWLPHPSILCVHTLVETADGWVVFALRSKKTAYYNSTWSVSFEEQAEVGVGRSSAEQPDRTVADVVWRGLREEFGLDGLDFDAWCLAIGREYTRSPLPPEPARRVVLGGTVLAAVRVPCSHGELWRRLSDSGRVMDKSEHVGWMACRFPSRVDVELLLRVAGPRASRSVGPLLIRNNDMLSIDIDVHPDSSAAVYNLTGNDWHPTARARLLLWSELAVNQGRLRPR